MPRFAPYRMDIATLDAHAQWGKPLTRTDEKNLARLAYHPLLADMRRSSRTCWRVDQAGAGSDCIRLANQAHRKVMSTFM